MNSALHLGTLLIWSIALCASALGVPCTVAQSSAGHSTVTPVRDADAVCGTCHQAIFQKYVTTPMANGSGVASERFIPGSLHHAASGMDYQMNAAEGAEWLNYQRAGDAAVQGRHKLEYFLGSGNLGTTYLYTEKGYLLESPIAYYSKMRAYDMAPGLSAADAMPAALPMGSACMRCHMSNVQPEDPGSRNHYSGLPFLHGGITCERCHGDAISHVISKGRQPVINPMKLDAAARDSVCINCHLEGDASVARKGRSVLDYKPGEHISDYLSYFVFAGDSTNRSVSETEELNASLCKRTSGSRMSCMSCHDPHGSPSKADRTAFYRSKCLACHTQVKYATTHYAATPDCTGCHMPKGGAQDTPHVAWTDHRIRQRPDALSLNLPTEAAGEKLVPVLSEPSTAQRDLALAYYALVTKGQTSEAERAWELLNEAWKTDPLDPAVLAALGYMNQMQKRMATAQSFYTEALKLKPEDIEVTNDLAGVLIQSGKVDEAQLLWQKEFDHNEDLDSVGFNLSIAQCITGDRNRSIETLKRLLLYSPDATLARRRLSALESGEESCKSH